jgi:hypothetical protein
MKRSLGVILLTLAIAAPCQNQHAQPAEQVWSGRLSDSMCAASHQVRMTDGKMSERECVFECIKALAKYVLVTGKDDTQQVIPIATQDLGGLPLYAGRLVRITGELRDGAIVAAKVEAIPAHLHLGHVMTNWRDTPSNVGFLTAAILDAKVAATHAELAAMSGGAPADEMKLHAGHVLHALDPSVEPKGPGSGYGVKKAATGALQHLEFAVNAEGSSANIKTYATQVSASLNDVLQWTDQAITVAQKIRAAKSASEAVPFVNELSRLTKEISEGGLQRAKTEMALMMKAEGLENAPR